MTASTTINSIRVSPARFFLVSPGTSVLTATLVPKPERGETVENTDYLGIDKAAQLRRTCGDYEKITHPERPPGNTPQIPDSSRKAGRIRRS
jgi:hypothetical protein